VARRDALSVALFARGATEARSREEAVLDALYALEDEGRIDEVEVHTWPAKVTLRTGAHSQVVETFESLRTWARNHDVSIQPPFAVREAHSAITGERETLLVTPTLCVAVYDAEELVGVYPSTNGDSVETIDDCLDRLGERGEPRRRARSEAATGPADRTSGRPTGTERGAR